MSLPAVMDRIAEIRQQLGLTTASTAASSSAFAAQLESATATTNGSATNATGSDVVAAAKQYLGVPYVWGGTDPATGLDCSGLVQKVYEQFGIKLPRLAGDQVMAGRPVRSLAEAQPGDLLGFGGHPMKHVGIYIGNGQMIHAPKPGKSVEISSVYETPTAIGRILPEQTAASAVTGAASTGAVGAGGSGSLAGVPYANLFEAAGARYGVSPALLAAVAKSESAYNPKAVSPVGAQGLMQLMPATARGLGVTNSFDPAQAVDGAAKMLAGLIDRFGDTKLAVAAYNAGPGAVARYGGIPPYRETQTYVGRVMTEFERLR